MLLNIAAVSAAFAVIGALAAFSVMRQFSTSQVSISISLGQKSPASTAVDVGNIVEGERPTRSFSIRNDSSREISILSHVSCGCVSVNVDPDVVGPGRTAQVMVTYSGEDVSAEPGGFKQKFTLEDRTDRALLLLGQVYGHSSPAIRFSPGWLSWELIAGRSEVPGKEVEITNLLSTPLKVRFLGNADAVAHVDVAPKTILLNPNQTGHIGITLQGKSEVSPFGAVARFESTATINGSPVCLHELIRLTATDREAITPLPGTIIFTSDEARSGTVKQLRIDSDASNAVSQLRARCSDDDIELSATSDPCVFDVKVRNAKEAIRDSTFEIRVSYVFKGNQLETHVPVLVY